MKRWTTGAAIWLTGVPASGKSTIAGILERRLLGMGQLVQNLDAEEWRSFVSPDLGFSIPDRDLNTRRLAYVQSLLARNGVHAIVAAVSSLRVFRDRARMMNDRFIEVYVKCSLDECRRRDPEGLYARGDRGEVTDIAGWHQPYEVPLDPEVTLDTNVTPAEQCADIVLRKMAVLGYLAKVPARAEGEATRSQHRGDD